MRLPAVLPRSNEELIGSFNWIQRFFMPYLFAPLNITGNSLINAAFEMLQPNRGEGKRRGFFDSFFDLFSQLTQISISSSIQNLFCATLLGPLFMRHGHRFIEPALRSLSNHQRFGNSAKRLIAELQEVEALKQGAYKLSNPALRKAHLTKLNGHPAMVFLFMLAFFVGYTFMFPILDAFVNKGVEKLNQWLEKHGDWGEKLKTILPFLILFGTPLIGIAPRLFRSRQAIDPKKINIEFKAGQKMLGYNWEKMCAIWQDFNALLAVPLQTGIRGLSAVALNPGISFDKVLRELVVFFMSRVGDLTMNGGAGRVLAGAGVRNLARNNTPTGAVARAKPDLLRSQLINLGGIIFSCLGGSLLFGKLAQWLGELFKPTKKDDNQQNSTEGQTAEIIVTRREGASQQSQEILNATS